MDAHYKKGAAKLAMEKDTDTLIISQKIMSNNGICLKGCQKLFIAQPIMDMKKG